MSQKTGRGKLNPATWRQSCEPVMCAYKLVTVHFKWFGFQNLVEGFAHKVSVLPLFDHHNIKKRLAISSIVFKVPQGSVLLD